MHGKAMDTDVGKHLQMADKRLGSIGWQRKEPLHLRAYELQDVEFPPVVMNFPVQLDPDWPTRAREGQSQSVVNMVADLGRLLRSLESGDDRAMVIAHPVPEYGLYTTGRIAWICGLNVREHGFVEPLASSDKVREFIDAGITDVTISRLNYWDRELRLCRSYLNEFDYLRDHVHIESAIIHSPFDVSALIWGSGIYVAMYEEPELVHGLMRLVTDVIKLFGRMQKSALGEELGYTYNSWVLNKAGIKLVEDTAMNISTEVYKEFCLPYTREVAEYFDGVFVHYCGHTLHWVSELLKEEKVYGFQHGYGTKDYKPQMRPVHDLTMSYNTCLQWFGEWPETWDPELKRGVILIGSATDVHDARDKVNRLRAAMLE
jgi:hypothetical protein